MSDEKRILRLNIKQSCGYHPMKGITGGRFHFRHIEIFW
jgi:hypothetical protein